MAGACHRLRSRGERLTLSQRFLAVCVAVISVRNAYFLSVRWLRADVLPKAAVPAWNSPWCHRWNLIDCARSQAEECCVLLDCVQETACVLKALDAAFVRSGSGQIGGSPRRGHRGLNPRPFEVGSDALPAGLSGSGQNTAQAVF